MDKLLQIKNISHEYKDFRLDSVSFSCEPGDIIGLIGIMVRESPQRLMPSLTSSSLIQD